MHFLSIYEKKDLNKHGFHKKYCPGFIPRGENCTHMGISVNCLEKEEEIWCCPECGEVICCHNGLCLNCNLDKLLQNKKYCWDDK